MPPFSIDPGCDTLCDIIRRWAEVRPDAPMIVDEGGTPLTYAGLVVVMDEVRATLNGIGFGVGDRIAIVHGGGPQAACAFLSVIDCATAILLNPAFSEVEFATHFRDRKVDAVLIEKDLDTAARAAAESHDLPVIDIEPGPRNAPAETNTSGYRGDGESR